MVAFVTGSELPAYCLPSLTGLGLYTESHWPDRLEIAGTKQSFVSKCVPKSEFWNEGKSA